MVLKFKIDRSELDCLIKENGGYKSPIFGVKYKKNHTEVANFVFVISKKEEPMANKRNNIRRRMKEAFRRVFVDYKMGIRGMVFCKKDIENKTFSEIVDEVRGFEKSLVF